MINFNSTANVTKLFYFPQNLTNFFENSKNFTNP